MCFGNEKGRSVVDDRNESGLSDYENGDDGCLLVPGNVLNTAISLKQKISKELKKEFSIKVIRSIKPLPEKALLETLKKFDTIITIEENTLIGGLGSAILEFSNERKLHKNILRFGTPDKFINAGNTKECTAECNLDYQSIFDTVKNKI